jgi:mannose-6-phosphate isomerase-like protein (cupin superfamily)
MKYLKKENAIKFEQGCIRSFEYPLGDKDLDCAVVEINGRYPEKDWTLNKKCKEIFYLIKGSGTLTTESESINLSEGDMAIINPEEKYYFEGKFTLLTPCTPAWSPDQTEIVK